jgi:DNA helicase-2/ATP-dependent DNA helicase PcrA
MLTAEAGREGRILTEEEGLSMARDLARGSSFSPRELLDRISLAKQHLLSPDETDDPDLGRPYAAYERRLAKQDLLDFDDLLAKAALLLGAGGSPAEDWGRRFAYLLVDEFQDVNLAQYRLARLLMPGTTPNVTVIGDPDQAIYGFRGADAAYFEKFREDYPACREVRLTQNYRSTDTILEASAQVIRHNPSPGRARLVSGLAGPARLRTATARTPQEEAVYVSSQIERLLGGTSHFALDSGRVEADASSDLSLGDIAVLYRLHAQAEPLAEALSRAALPFQQAGAEALHETDRLDFKAEKINLLTMHAAKGLEFEVVFIVGVEEGLLPYEPPGGRPASLEEERRLFYVAMTRARQQLFLTRSLKRTLFGRRRTPGPSPFWEEISAKLREKAEIERKYRPKSEQMSLF